MKRKFNLILDTSVGMTVAVLLGIGVGMVVLDFLVRSLE